MIAANPSGKIPELTCNRVNPNLLNLQVTNIPRNHETPDVTCCLLITPLIKSPELRLATYCLIVILTIDIVLEDFLGVLIGIAMIPFAAAAVVIIFILGIVDVVRESFEQGS